MLTAKRTLALLILWHAMSLSLMAQEKNDPAVYDEEVKILEFVDVSYPAAAQRAGVEGFVVVSATLNDQGRSTSAMAVSGPRLLIAASLENVRQWRFEPNRTMRVILIYRFTLVDRCASGTAPSFFTPDGQGPNVVSITACRIVP